MKIIIFTISIFASVVMKAQTFTLKSTELSGQATSKQVFDGFGCTGENKSPQLYWENPPIGTKSFAVTMHDQDAPTGSGWWHWLIFDIPSSIKELKPEAGNLSKNIAPTGAIQSTTDYKTEGYGGPCPPAGRKPHKYTITVYALKTDKLGLDKNANPALVGFMLEQNLLEKSSIVLYYKR